MPSIPSALDITRDIVRMDPAIPPAARWSAPITWATC